MNANGEALPALAQQTPCCQSDYDHLSSVASLRKDGDGDHLQIGGCVVACKPLACSQAIGRRTENYFALRRPVVAVVGDETQ